MVKICLTSFLLLFAAIGFSQNAHLDSLQHALTSQHGLQKVKTMNALSKALLPLDLDQAKSFAQSALEMAKTLKDWEGSALAYDNLGAYYLAVFDHERAMKAYLEGLKLRDQHHDELGAAVSRIHIGKVFFQMEDLTQAEESLIKALEIAQNLKAGGEGATAMEALGDVYFARKIYGKSLDQYRQALELNLSVQRFQAASEIAARLGQISGDLGDQEGATVYYRTALNLYRELGDQPQIARIQTLIANALALQGAWGEAIERNQDAYNLRNVLRDSVGMAENLQNIGLSYLATGNKEVAAKYLTDSESLLDKCSVNIDVPNIYLAIAETHAKMGNHELAFLAQKKFSDARNIYFNQEKSKALLDLTTKYESEFEAQKKQAKIELLEIENANSRRVSYILFIMIGLFGMLLVNLFLSYRRKKKANFLLQAKNVEILEHKNAIDQQNEELESKNVSLDLLNKKLLDEIAERETIEKSSFARDRFLATMSHEMRTPLNIITGLTHLLLESEPLDDQVEHLRTLQYSANDLVVFINDVLDFSKIEAGKLNLEDRPFLLAQAFREVQTRFEYRAEEKGILFNVFQDPKLPRELMGDNARLMQILNNLLTNTFQHTNSGYVKVDVSMRELSVREAIIEIVVEGSDGGIKRNTLEALPKPWDIDNEDGFSGYEGQHFSLTITKRLVELQNGKMEVEVNEGESTVFYVLLPFKLVEEGKERTSRDSEKKDYSDLAGKRVLVVEDNKINQVVVAKLLRKLDIEVTTANNGLEALEVFDQQYFDLVLMDIQMPEMDGYRATSEIRRHPDSTKNDVPIIALTASAFLTEKDKAVLFGMNDHVGKPFAPGELLEKMQHCLSVYSKERV